MLVNSDETSFINQGLGISDQRRSSHGRNDVEGVEIDLDVLLVLKVSENSNSVVLSDFNEVVLEVGGNMLTVGEFLELLGISGLREDGRSGSVVGDVGINLLGVPGVMRKMHNLLRSTSALNGHGGVGEDGVSSLKIIADSGPFLSVSAVVN